MGAKKIIAIDIYNDRLSLAKEFGADYVINAKQENNIMKKIKKITKGVGADYVIEVTGSPKVIDQGIKFLRIGGKYILLGAIYPGSKFVLDSSEVITKCIQIIGMHNYKPEALDLAIKLMLKTQNKYPYKKLVGIQCDLTLDGIEDEEKEDSFDQMYKGEVSKSGAAILPSKRVRRIPDKTAFASKEKDKKIKNNEQSEATESEGKQEENLES